MRTARYNDYFLLNMLKGIVIIAIIAAVVAGVCFGFGEKIMGLLFPQHEHSAGNDSWTTVEPTCDTDGYRYKICTEDGCGEEFDREVLPATGHQNLDEKKENEKDHTTTEGGSYELVVYCLDCGAEDSRETVWVGQKHTPEIIETKENIVDPTCTESGGYVLVKTCACGEEISREEKIVEPNGHDYKWTAQYNKDTNTYSLHGVCGTDSNETIVNQYDYNVNFAVEGDETVATCCPTRYIVSCTYNGERVQAFFDFDPPRHNHTVEYYDDEDLLYNPQPIYLTLPDPSYDTVYGEYYNIDEISGIEPYNVGNSVWDENGFSYGVFKCHACEEHGCTACAEHGYRFFVRIYSAEYDTRLEDDSTKI